MGNFFGSIYCWLEDFFGLELAEYLWGNSAPGQLSNMFISIGLTMLLISLSVAVCYYYIINHPRLNNWWGWLIFLGINAIVNLIVGWQWVLKDYYDGLMKVVDPTTNENLDLPISEGNIFAFGVTNMIDSIIVFILFSYLIKWWSSNCSKAPW